MRSSKQIRCKDSEAKRAFIHAALLLGFASFEAHVNAIADDFLATSDLDPHERGLLPEHVVELADGEFKERPSLKIQRLEDRVLFLGKRFSKTPIDRAASYWGDFAEATRLRNNLTHPKSTTIIIGEAAAKRSLMAIIELLNHLYV